MKKILILGIGNPIRYDDGVGNYTAEMLKNELYRERAEGVEVKDTSAAGLRLLDLMDGYDKVILIDSIQTGGRAGNIYRFPLKEAGSFSGNTLSHNIGIPLVLSLAKKLDLSVPGEIVLYAIEIEKKELFGEGLTPRIKKAAVKTAGLVKHELLMTGINSKYKNVLKRGYYHGNRNSGYSRAQVPAAGIKTGGQIT